MAVESFFNAPDVPADKIGGWLCRGHDRNDVYQEYVVKGAEFQDPIPRDWIDWCRIPLERGSLLLEE